MTLEQAKALKQGQKVFCVAFDATDKEKGFKDLLCKYPLTPYKTPLLDILKKKENK